jgi:hypothetical protein
MVAVHCRTNLDLDYEEWPTELPEVPRVGDKVQSAQVWNHGFQLTLTVVAVLWRANQPPVIELHSPCESIIDFYERYAPYTGRSPHSFY